MTSKEGYDYKSIVSSRPLLDKPKLKERGILSFLNLSIDSLRNKKILEVAGGGGATLEEAVSMGLDWYYVDPLLVLSNFSVRKHQANIRRLLKLSQFSNRIHTGVSNNLRFRDNQFSISLSVFGIPLVCRTIRSAQKSISEMIRVTSEKVILNISADDFAKISGREAFFQNETIIGQGRGAETFLQFPLMDYLNFLIKRRIISYYDVEECLIDSKEAVLTIHK